MNACTKLKKAKGCLKMKQRIPVGLQLYTLRDELGKDFWGTLEVVAKMGYETVEMAGYYRIPAEEMRAGLDRLGLKAVSSHVGFTAMRDHWEEEIAYAKALGLTYFVVPYLGARELEDEDQLQQVIEVLQRAGERCEAEGLVLAYHNHDHEMKVTGGVRLLDRLMEEVPTMQVELDLYWVKKGGADPIQMMEQYRGRLPLVHVKDMADDAEGSFAEVGYGIMDYPTILRKAAECGVKHFIVEQDRCNRSPLDSIRMSITYLRSLGLAK